MGRIKNNVPNRNRIDRSAVDCVPIASSAQSVSYGVYDLSNLMGDNTTYYGVAYGINDFLDVVGYNSRSEDDTVEIPFGWNGVSGLRALSGPYGVARSINNRREPVGDIKSRQGNTPVRWNKDTGNIATSLPGLGTQSSATCMSIGGWVGGWTNQWNGITFKFDSFPCVWTPTQENIQVTIDIICQWTGTGYRLSQGSQTWEYTEGWACTTVGPNLKGCKVSGIAGPVKNPSPGSWGEIFESIVGQPSIQGSTMGFLLKDNHVTVENSSFTATNETGGICGYTNVPGNSRAFLQIDGVRAYIPLIPGDLQNFAYALNNRLDSSCSMLDPLAMARRGILDQNIPVRPNPQVVGVSRNAIGQAHAYVWSAETGTIALPEIGGGDSWAYGINELGEICGASKDSSGKTRAVIWLPITDESNQLAPVAVSPPARGEDSGMPNLSPGQVSLSGWVVIADTIMTASGACSYVQHPNLPFGTKVRGAYGLRKGLIVNLGGTLTVENNEKVIRPSLILVEGTALLPKPLGASNNSYALSAKSLGATIAGLRSRIWGRVFEKANEYGGGDFYYIDDGNGYVENEGYPLYDHETGLPVLDPNGNLIIVGRKVGIRVYTTDMLEIGSFCILEGVSGNQQVGKVIPTLWDASLIQKY